MKIAIIDDEEILLFHFERILRELLPSAQIYTFDDCAELLDNAKSIKFDMVFLDIQMPGMTGVELAEELKKIYEKINIIFVTGYDGYQSKAMELFASGYVKKPVTKEKIREQLEHLRYPVEKDKRIFAQTFGNFTLFVDGKPVKFAREKSQEIMAYLIHRQGSLVSKKELSAVLFDDGLYDDNRRSYISKICSEVIKKLTELGVADIIVKSSTDLAVNTEMLNCDLYDYLNGKEGAMQKYHGEYMSQYSFGEEMIPYLEK